MFLSLVVCLVLSNTGFFWQGLVKPKAGTCWEDGNISDVAPYLFSGHSV